MTTLIPHTDTDWIAVAQVLAAALAEKLTDPDDAANVSRGFHLVLHESALDGAPHLKSWRDNEGNLHVMGRWDVHPELPALPTPERVVGGPDDYAPPVSRNFGIVED